MSTMLEARIVANEATPAAPAAQDPVREKERVELRPAGRDTDFKERYPPDRELGHELDDTARVWKVYRGEAIDHDDALLKTWNDTVNILLTFAGLFSAAVTSFVIASTDNLKPDPNAYVANLLFAMGNANGDNASPFAHLPAPPPLEATPTSLARVVNGFWYTSLFLALAAALLCILVKQWLDEYTARTRGSAKHPHEWAQRRSFYFQGLTDWNVAAIISFLPLFLHLALFLFLAGLTGFLWDLDSAICWVVLALMLLLLAFYAVSLLIPVWCAACPYATPLLAQLRNFGYTALIAIRVTRDRSSKVLIRRLFRHVRDRRLRSSLPISAQMTGVASSEGDLQIKVLRNQRSRRPFERVLLEVRTMEHAAKKDGDFEAHLDCSALSWLMHDVSDSDAVAVAWHSLGALLEEPESVRSTCIIALSQGLMDAVGGYLALWRTLRMDGALDDMQIGRITRSVLFIAPVKDFGFHVYWDVPRSDGACLENTLFPDAALIYAHGPLPDRNFLFDRPESIVRAICRLHEQGPHRPLPSTAISLVYKLSPRGSSDWVPEALVGLLSYCELGELSATAWTRIATGLGQICTGRESNPSHGCTTCCVVNALCTRALRLMDETSGALNPRQNPRSAAPFDAYSHLQLGIRILCRVRPPATHLSAAVRMALTDKRYFSSRRQRAERIRAADWAEALYILATRSSDLYASFATQYNLIWNRLLCGYVRNHL